MGELFLYIAFTIFLPVLLLIIFLEKRARRVMLSFLCGILACLAAYFINSFISGAANMANDSYSMLPAPIIEESLKFIPLLLFCFILKKGKRQTIAMAFSLGVGFCVVENYYYLFSNAHSADLFWVIARCIGTGLMHSISTTLIGFGLYLGRIKEKAVLFGALSFVIAVLYHGIYNYLVADQNTQLIGLCIPIISYIVLVVILKQETLKTFFDEDDDITEN